MLAGHTGTSILFGAFDVSEYFRELTATLEGEELDSTTFPNAARRRTGGLKDGALSLSGFYDTDAAADANLRSAIASTAVTTVAFDTLALGQPVGLLEGVGTSYEISDPVDGLVEVSVEMAGDGGLDFGVSLHALASEAASGNGTSVDQTAATTDGGVGHIHVTSGTGSLVGKVQHSVDDSAWVDLITFTTATGATAERVAVTGTVNRYIRALWTVTTGPFVFQLSFARR